ncbi:MAG: dTMP kinase [Candidatus Levybacteria bacterium RIFCSPHIGHO2_12_FULL_37_9]|nr:MAG: dTMP kinase [Candidatus Levybacteria bacterium RIFCSPHIGHO2_12_FULL_37_9]
MKYHIEFDIELRKNPYKGKYFAFEGIDGCGKTTQVEIIKNYLLKKGKSVAVTSEPRKEGSAVGRLIHEILQSRIKVPPQSLQYLYTAERIINHKEVVEPSLKNGKIVLSHRSLWSNVPYGMFDRGVINYDSPDTKLINITQGLMSLYHQFIVPDITFYLRVSADTAMKRLKIMDKVKEVMYEKKEKLEKIARGYEWQVKQFPNHFVVIDGEKSAEEVTGEIIKKLEARNPKSETISKF